MVHGGKHPSQSIRKLTRAQSSLSRYRLDHVPINTGAIGVCENAWFLPEKTPYQIDERMEILGTERSLHIQETGPNFSVRDRNGWRLPDTTYWPTLHGQVRSGAIREELAYFANCVLKGRSPTL